MQRAASLAGPPQRDGTVATSSQQWQALPTLEGRDSGRYCLQPAWLDPDGADALLALLRNELPWTNHPVKIFGRELASPRLSSWHGDPAASYRYSGQRHSPQPWTPALLRLRQRLADSGVPCNAVLANLYRTGDDAMGWHADDEPELGANPLIASISLGASRRFVLRPHPRRVEASQRGLRQALELGHGSLLLMAGPTQHHWQHALPRMRRVTEPRINLTFRWIDGTESGD